MNYFPICSREQSTPADCWQEYLCATQHGEAFDLAICIHEPLGCAPAEWFDEDGEPAPHVRDEDGHFKLPEFYEGKPVEGYDGEYLLGPLGPWTNEETRRIDDLSLGAVEAALSEMGWPVADANDVLAALRLVKEGR